MSAPPLHPPDPPQPAPLAPAHVDVDRPGMLMRFAWRAAVGAGLIGAGRLLWGAFDWALLRRTDAASYLAFGALLMMLALFGLLICGSALRWLLLGCRPGRLGFTWTEREITVELGPFGRRRLDRGRLVVRDVPDRWSIGDESDERLPRLSHPDFSGDLADAMIRFSRWEPIRLRQMLLQSGVITAPPQEPDDPDAFDSERVRRALAKYRRR